MTQARHSGDRRDADQAADDPRVVRATRRRPRVILTQPPPPPPVPARPDRDEEEPPAPEPTGGASADDPLLATIDELIAGR